MSTEHVYIRTNGRGNAWPVPLGYEHPFYSIEDIKDLANAAFSIISSREENIARESINWEVMIDGGHGAIQYMINQQNRIPEAIVLTHPHHDHTYSIDWVIQSYYRSTGKTKRYPLYASRKCYDFVIQCYPHLADLVEFKELKYGRKTEITETSGLAVTAFPVYHGKSAKGASLLLFEKEEQKVIFTGDILCPLIREEHNELLMEADAVYVDANNRFSYPDTNHWSIMFANNPIGVEAFTKWKKKIKLSDMLEPHGTYNTYFDASVDHQFNNSLFPCSVFEFMKQYRPKNVFLVHYSGREDHEIYDEKIFNESELEEWVNIEKENNNLNTKIFLPKVGDLIKLK